MDSGIYIRVGIETLALEEMSEEKRTEWLNGLDKEALIRTINRLCETLYEHENSKDILRRNNNDYL